MRMLVVSILVIFLSIGAQAKNIELENTEENCQKVSGFDTDALLTIATKQAVPFASVYFMKASWTYGKWGGKSCVFLFDTAKGPKKCMPYKLLSSDGGRTAFGWLSFFENVTCW